MTLKVIIKFYDRTEELKFVSSIEFNNGYLCIVQKTKDYNRETNYKWGKVISFEVKNETDLIW